MSFFLACLWLICLLVAFSGYGLLILRLCARPGPGFALSAAVGVAVFVAIGGVLNLAHEIRPAVVIALVAPGIGLALVLRAKAFGTAEPSKANSAPRAVGIALFAAALLVPILGNVRADVRSFNLYDDLPAYLTLPIETLQLHTLPADPFNERRVTSCLGAPYFLQACLLPGEDVRELRAMDVSIGWILYAALMLAVLDRIGVDGRWRVPIAALILILPVYRINATFVVLPAALFCALFLLLMEQAVGWRRAIPLALVAGALCAIKSNYLPAAVLCCVFFYAGVLLTERRGRVLTEALLCGLVAAALLAPWMLDLHAKEGTYLFPILGRGFDASAYGTVPLPNGSHSGVSTAGTWVWITTAAYAGPYVIALLAVAYAWVKKWEARHALVALGAMLCATVVTIAALASSTGGESIGRYSLPFQVPVLLIFGGYVVRWMPHRREWAWRAPALTSAVYAVFLAGLFGIHHGQYRTYLEDARLLTPPGETWFSPAVERARLAALQRTIPPGGAVLARLFVTYPFDFRRNRIFVADYTGMAGAPPGMPVNQSAEAVRHYLLSKGIRYLAYDYRRTALPDDDPNTGLSEALADPSRYGRHGWLYMQVKVTNAEQNLFAELGERCRRLYDDGEVFVLDLALPPQQRTPQVRSAGLGLLNRALNSRQVIPG